MASGISEEPRSSAVTAKTRIGGAGSSQSFVPFTSSDVARPPAPRMSRPGDANGSAFVQVSAKSGFGTVGMLVALMKGAPSHPGVASPYLLTPVGSRSSLATMPSVAPPFQLSSTDPGVTGKLGDRVELTTTASPAAVFATPAK